MIALTVLVFSFASPAAPATRFQQLQLILRSPKTTFALNESIKLDLVFLNSGLDTLVLLRPKPEQSLIVTVR